MTTDIEKRTARIIELMILNNLPLSVQELVLAQLHQLSEADLDSMSAELERLDEQRKNLGKASRQWLLTCKEVAARIAASLDSAAAEIEKELEEELGETAKKL